MGLGSLATIAVKHPPNLAILVLDNEHYGETGQQETHTKHGVDLVAIARGAGFRQSVLIRTEPEIPALHAAIQTHACLFAVAKIDPETLPLVLPPRDGALLQARMREAVMGPAAHHQL